jgi:macrodomain Ter protein organizer (MatP/YcbG family)
MGYTARTRLSTVEKKIAFTLAKKAGMNLSEYIRYLIFQANDKAKDQEVAAAIAAATDSKEADNKAS